MANEKKYNNQTPAHADGMNPGLTKREYTAIHTRIPLSADPDLDKLISLAQRRDMILQLKISNPEMTIEEAIDISQQIIEKGNISNERRKSHPHP